MKFKQAQILAGCALSVAASLLLFGSVAGGAAKTARISDVLNASEPYTIMAVLPDVPAFITKLRSGVEMRAFFDSPLGLHFLKSAPLRGAAHLHRFISYAPHSWQWNLYTLVSDGPVFYRSHGQKFILAIALNRNGQLATSLAGSNTAQKVGEWFIVASDKEELARQVDYMKKPVPTDLPLDSMLAEPGAMGLDFRFSTPVTGKRSLFRSLLGEALSTKELTGCTVSLTPGANSIQINGDCRTHGSAQIAPVRPSDETIAIPDYPAVVYYRRTGHKPAYLLALHGFVTDYGYLVPQLFFSGPTGDQKAVEFLTQAFKAKNHQIESEANAIRIRYPYAYRYDKRKFDIFSPYLTANADRFFWQTFLPEKKSKESQLNLSHKYGFYAKVNLHALIRNSQPALKQYDAIYSPGHFNEFRDALAKSLNNLKNSSFQLYSETGGKNLRIGGMFAFAEN